MEQQEQQRRERQRWVLETLLTQYTGSRERARAWLERIDADPPVDEAELEVLAMLAYGPGDEEHRHP